MVLSVGYCHIYRPVIVKCHSWVVNSVGIFHGFKLTLPYIPLWPVYAVLTELPAVFLLYDSSLWSGAFIILIFAVSVWNGGGFYIEVFGRKFAPSPFVVTSRLTSFSSSRFERELEALRKELADNVARSGNSTPDQLGHIHSDSTASSMGSSPVIVDGSLSSVTSLELSPKLSPLKLSKEE